MASKKKTTTTEQTTTRMTWKDLRSDDARKPAAVARLKAASGCRKVTQVQICSDEQTVRGNCMNPNQGGEPGMMTTTLALPHAPLSPGLSARWNEMVQAAEIANPERAEKKEKTPAKPRKALVVDACAAPGCYAPIAGDGLCHAHVTAKIEGASLVRELEAKERKANAKVEATLAALRPGRDADLSPRQRKAQAKGLANLAAVADAAIVRICPVRKCGRSLTGNVCEKHGEQKAVRDVAAALASPAGLSVKVSKAEKLAAEIDALPRLPAKKPRKAKRTAAPVVPDERTSSRGETEPLMAKLLAAGWTVASIARELGLAGGGPVWNWKVGKAGASLENLAKLRELVGKAPPARGTLRAPSKAARRVAVKAPRRTDDRQLLLNLQAQVAALTAALLKK